MPSGTTVAVAIVVLPIAAGLAGTLAPAFGIMPALGFGSPSLEPWRALLAEPGLVTSVRLTVVTGTLATLLSLVLAVGLVGWAGHRRWFRAIERLLAPLLAVPHAAVAVGLQFLILPSGWLARLVSPELSGWERPPAIVTVGDPWGLALVGGLVLKEVPFLVLAILAASRQANVADTLRATAALGYGHARGWLFTVFPAIYRQIRLPVCAVLVFSLSVVDVTLVLGPSHPPPLAVLVARWFADFELTRYPVAAAGATLVLVVAACTLGCWRLGEIAAGEVGRRLARRGSRTGALDGLMAPAAILALASGLAGLSAIVVMGLWSVAETWRFPDAWPDAWTPRTWLMQMAPAAAVAGTTAVVALASTIVCVAVVLAALESEAARGGGPDRRLSLLLIPLFLPQIAFLFGAQVLLLHTGLDGTLVAVIVHHSLFVLPYVWLALADPFRALDPRYRRTAAMLGAGRVGTFFRVTLPILAPAVAIAAAIGVAVSVGQYLPTVFAGNGRIATLTTEAVALASGGDRRVLGVYATLQSLLPLAAFALALALPGLRARRTTAITDQS